jgi:hypothetical protein
MPKTALFRLNADLSYDIAPRVILRADKVTRFLGRAGAGRIEADISQSLHDFGLLEDIVQFSIHPLHNRGWHPTRRHDGHPPAEIESRQSLSNGRNVLVSRSTLLHADRQRT